MRVLFVDQFSEFGGAQFGLRDIMTEAIGRGWHVEFMAPGNGGLFEFCKAAGIESHRLALGGYSNGSKSLRDVLGFPIDTVRASRAVRAVVSRRQIALVVANGPRILPAVAHAGMPVVFHLHSRVDQRYARAILQLSLWRSRAIPICCSNFVAATLNGAPSRIIYNGVADCGFNGVRLTMTNPRIAIIGRLSPEKGHPDFIRAAAIVAKSWPGARFSIHGEPLFSDGAFERDLQAMSGAARVEFHGWTDDVPGVLRQTDILVVPSKAVEATPRVIMEAFSAGTPVIAYSSGGIPELIRHGHTGLLTAQPNHRSLAEAIERLLADAELRTLLARNGRREWEQRFRLDRFQRDICDLLEGSANESRKPESAAAIACKNDLA